MARGKSASLTAASYAAKLEGGRYEARLSDIRSVFAILKKQHLKAKRGDPSLLRLLIKEVGRKKPKKKSKKR